MNRLPENVWGSGCGERILSVLIVDDSRDSLLSLEDLILVSGHSPLCAATPRAAIEVASKQQFDLAFVDYRLPEMNGVELICRLRTIVPQSRFALISGYSAVCLPDACKEANASIWFRKPLMIDPILDFINENL